MRFRAVEKQRRFNGKSYSTHSTELVLLLRFASIIEIVNRKREHLKCEEKTIPSSEKTWLILMFSPLINSKFTISFTKRLLHNNYSNWLKLSTTFRGFVESRMILVKNEIADSYNLNYDGRRSS